MSGKGDTPRPLSVSAEVFAGNWDLIFKKPVVDPTANPITVEPEADDDEKDLRIRPGQDAS